MSFGMELNGFVNGVFCVFDLSKSQIWIGWISIRWRRFFTLSSVPLLVLFKKVKMHNSIACKSQLCALHVTNTPATQTYHATQLRVQIISHFMGHVTCILKPVKNDDVPLKLTPRDLKYELSPRDSQLELVNISKMCN